MKDTPQHVEDLQRELWMQKSDTEKLETYLIENEQMYLQWISTKTKEEVLQLQLEKAALEKKIMDGMKH